MEATPDQYRILLSEFFLNADELDAAKKRFSRMLQSGIDPLFAFNTLVKKTL